MKFYAYLGTKEPMGTEGKLLFELKTPRGAHRRCRSVFGKNKYRLFSYTNIYDGSSFKEVSPYAELSCRMGAVARLVERVVPGSVKKEE